jgi:hypothetical protein
MIVQRREAPASMVDFAPKRASRDNSVSADETGNGIIALLHEAAESAKEDCARAMKLAHKWSKRFSRREAACKRRQRAYLRRSSDSPVLS